jgi:hypothetical protein
VVYQSRHTSTKKERGGNKRDDDLQRLLHKFKLPAEKYNTKIQVNKRKSLTVSKEPTRVKLEMEGEPTEQLMKFKYLGTEINCSR